VTSDVVLTLDDGSAVTANIRDSLPDARDVQEYQADGHLSTDVMRIERSSIWSVEPVPSFASGSARRGTSGS